VLARDQEDPVVDARDHERSAVGHLRAQGRDQDAEIGQDGRRKGFTSPFATIAESRDGEATLLHRPPSESTCAVLRTNRVNPDTSRAITHSLLCSARYVFAVTATFGR